jgi:DNA-binding NarL/FixJ family response regulator
MTLVVSGLLNKQVAAELTISEKTVKVHRARAMEKMNVESLAELVLIASKLGLTSDRPASGVTVTEAGGKWTSLNV